MNEKFKILLIEDNDNDAELVFNYVQEMGRDKYEFTRAPDLKSGKALIASQRFDLILLDLHLPDSDGMATLRAICDDCDAMSPMVLVLTGMDDQEIAEEAMRSCAQNYLVKGDITAKSLMRAIAMAVSQYSRDRVSLIERKGATRTNDVEFQNEVAGDALETLDRVNKLATAGPATTGEPGEPVTLSSDLTTASRASGAAIGALGHKVDEILRQVRELRADLAGMHHRLRIIESSNQGRDSERAAFKAELKAVRRAIRPIRLLFDGSGQAGPLHHRLATSEQFISTMIRDRENDRKFRLTTVKILVTGVLAWLGAVATPYLQKWFFK